MPKFPLFAASGLLGLLLVCNVHSESAKAAERCILETYDITTGQRETILETAEHIEAPNWTRDGGDLVFNKGGSLFRVSVHGGEPKRIDTGSATRCNNDHGISPDGRMLAISDESRPGGSQIYTVPITGGEPVRVTQPGAGSAYWHGWSPDGKTLAFVGGRKGNNDIYVIPVAGGAEVRLTTTPGKDDGPDYSADGRCIYYNSYQAGHMQIWRMDADGTHPAQLTADSYSNWFPHPSPDGKWIVFLSFFEDQADSHPANKNVMLRLMPVAGGEPRILAKFVGGQGTINVPSWAPDSNRFAFVSYPPRKDGP